MKKRYATGTEPERAKGSRLETRAEEPGRNGRGERGQSPVTHKPKNWGEKKKGDKQAKANDIYKVSVPGPTS